MSDVLKAAKEYHRRGLPLALCLDKKPIGTGWPSKDWTLRELDQAFRKSPDLNVGLVLGPRSGMIDLEADSPAAERDYAKLFEGDVPVVPTFQSARGKHRLFQFPKELAATNKAVVHFGALEIRLGSNGKGAQSLLPPSKTSGFSREWLVGLDEVDPPELPNTVIDRILQASKPRIPPSSVPVYTETQAISCVSVSLCKPVIEAITRTVPSGRGHRHRRLFHFARILKSIPEVVSAEKPVLKDIVREWHRLALPTIGTKPFEETWGDFFHAWQNVRIPAGEGIRMVYEQAIKQLPKCARQYEQIEVRRLVALCRQLQLAAGDKPFFLACRTAGELLGVSHVVANKWLRLLVADDLLEMVKPNEPYKATEFRYRGD